MAETMTEKGHGNLDSPLDRDKGNLHGVHSSAAHPASHHTCLGSR